ncbi:mtDNA inheritance, partitioning of the mitochondrial organelle [Podila epigama]|nr:mtDNA inheritance, partitioning of the mitochondrial organelle [Podila epigama]
MHEIVTLQFGQYANFVGTHFWNTQEAHFNYQQVGEEEEQSPELVNHDCLYRIGQTIKGTETYTPRALIFDLKGGFGSIKKYKLYESEATENYSQTSYDLSWDPSKMETFEEQPYSPSAYQKHLEEEEMGMAEAEGEDDVEMNEIRTWSDYNRVYFHPKSLVTASGYQLGSEFMPFDVYSYGRSAFIETEKEKESYDENLRLFTEECDQLQGFQVLADVLDGWGGFATSYLEQLREDFPKTTIVTYGLSHDKMGKTSTMREKQTTLVNEALSLTNLSRLSSLYIPVKAPTKQMLVSNGWSKYIRLDGINKYLLSLIARESLPYKCIYLRRYRLCAIAMQDDQVFSQSVVLRGLQPNQFARYAQGTQRTPREVVDELLDTLPVGKSLGDMKTQTAFKYLVPTSFPRFFQNLTAEGHTTVDPHAPNLREDGTSKVEHVPTITRLAVSTTTRWHLETLSDSVKKINLKLLPEFDGLPGGVNNEEFDDTKERLLDLYDIYNE